MNLRGDTEEYLKERKKFWFKRKRYGWGWYPATWQGWVVVLVWVFIFTLILDKFSRDADLPRLLISFAIITFALIFLSYKKGEKPKWQWGEKENEKNSEPPTDL
jgi:polyferredoxin